MQVALEDSLVTMSTILSSRFVAGIRPEVEKVERQLNNFSDTLDQWVQVREVVQGCICNAAHVQSTAHADLSRNIPVSVHVCL
jgi:hypothetical protein